MIVVGLSYAEETDMAERAAAKLVNLQDTVAASACKRGKLCKQAAGDMKSAIRHWSRGDFTKTERALDSLYSKVSANITAFNGNTNENFHGNILARILNFKFTYRSKIEPYLEP
jgi:hypothetical protein